MLAMPFAASILRPLTSQPQSSSFLQQLCRGWRQPSRSGHQESWGRDQQYCFSSRPISHASSPNDRRLSDIMNVQQLQHETADAIEHIWLSHHASLHNHVASVLNKEEHAIIAARAAASPLFVLPMSKQAGAFQTLLLQWQPPHRLLYTTLQEYKQAGAQATAHMTVHFFDEVSQSHGLVLARGDVPNLRLISAAEGRTLLELTRAFYTDASAYQMVYAFNHKPQQFDFQQLCKELGLTIPTA